MCPLQYDGLYTYKATAYGTRRIIHIINLLQTTDAP